MHFVTMTGGEYFFQPSIDALFLLAGAKPPGPDEPGPEDEGDADDPAGFDFCKKAGKDGGEPKS